MPGSVLLHLSNNSSTQSDSKHGGNFRNILGNAPAGRKPHTISTKALSLTHLFGNINEYTDTFQYKNSATGETVFEVTIPRGQYTASELFTALNVAWAGALVFTDIDAPATKGLMTVENTDLVTYTLLSTPGSLVEMLGITSDLAIPPTTTVQTTVTRNISGPHMIFFHSNRIGHGNFLHGDGRSHNIFETLDLTKVNYGEQASKDIQDVHMNIITFDGPEELSDIDVYVTDERMRRLELPPTSKIDIIFRVVHAEDSL